jgi:hypothetical protein
MTRRNPSSRAIDLQLLFGLEFPRGIVTLRPEIATVFIDHAMNAVDAGR